MDVREPTSNAHLIRYRTLRGDSLARPYVMCSAKGWAQRLPALVDSGADGSSLPTWVAELLGVRYDRDRSRMSFGAGGEFAEYEAEDDVVIESEIGRITLLRPAINAALPFVLLGRRDFFDRCRVCFDQRAQLFEIDLA